MGLERKVSMENIYTVKEASKILKTNTNYVYELIKRGIIPALKIGSFKIRQSAIENFLEKYEGKDLTDLSNIKELRNKEKYNPWN